MNESEQLTDDDLDHEVMIGEYFLASGKTWDPKDGRKYYNSPAPKL